MQIPESGNKFKKSEYEHILNIDMLMRSIK